MTFVKKFIPSVSSGAGSLAGWLIVLISLVMGYDVFLQITIKHGTSWAYEFTSYGLIWFAFLSAGFVLALHRHIHLELFVSRFSTKTQLVLRMAGTTLIVLFVMCMTYYMFDLFIKAFAVNERASTITRTPMFVVYLGASIGLVVFLLQSLHTLASVIRQAWNAEGKVQYAPIVFLVGLLAVGIGLWTTSPETGLLIILIAFLLGGVPIFATLGIAGSIGLLALSGLQFGLPQIAQISYKALDSNGLLAIPLFVLAGVVLQRGKIGPELYQFATAWLGHIKGGYGIATVLACGIFAAVSGSSVATAAAIGSIAIPEMLKRNYRDWKVYGLLAGGGTLGILIPPSTPMILYSGMTNESTGQLFMGGVFPGIVVMVLFAIYTYFTTEKSTVTAVASWAERWEASKHAVWGFLLPIIIIFGIYLGTFTPTQAGAVAVIYAVIVSFARKSISLKEIPSMLAEGTLSSGMILMIIVGALILGQVVTLLKIPDNLLGFITESGMQPWVVLLIITIGYLILGMFMEVVSILLITLPVVYPLITSLGINGLWFGVYLTMLMEFALITPPVGLNLFVIKDISKSDIGTVVKGTWAYVILLGIGVILITIFPQLVLWLPSKLIGR